MIVAIFLSWYFMDVYTNPPIVPYKRFDLLIKQQLITLVTNEAAVALCELNQSDCLLFIYSCVLLNVLNVLGASQVKPTLTCSGMRTLPRASR